VLLLASMADQELDDAVGRRHGLFSPLAVEAGLGKTPPAAVDLQKVVRRHIFIELSGCRPLHSHLRPPEKQREKEEP
jgi:hypothetical protein